MLAALRCARRTLRGPTPLPQIARARRHYAYVTALSSLPQTGTQLHGFTLQRAEHIPELELSALHFQHDKTGADYLHIARDDKNNVFTIGFKTNPPDATGVPHILEHVTLCGSEKYPVRDPFFKMLPRSLQNFMNAMTSSHFTYYPFATTNAQDFKNLLGVYVDATLHPLLKRSDFVQEGWRLGPSNPLESKDSEGVKDIVFKGVVYNEMKGQMSDAMYLYYIRFMEHIFPSLNNSGGDPEKMTDLTYEQLRKFHQEHYHPTNSKIVTYGDQPVEGHLELLGPQLDQFSKVDVDRDQKMPITLDGPREVILTGPVDPLTPVDAQYKTSTTWLCGDTSDIHESFALQIAFSILMGGYGSPLYRALIESGLGTDFSPNSGYDTSSRRAIFSVGVNGVTKENVPKVKQAIEDTLREVAETGIESPKIDGTLHQLELSLKHKSASFGLGITQMVEKEWFNDLDPFDSLSFNTVLNHFKAEYSKGRYLENLLKKYFSTDNTFTFTMAPSETYASELKTEEETRLQAKISDTVAGFSSEQEAHKHLRERELELMEEQSSGQEENIDSLPTLRVTDIDRVQPVIETRDSSLDSSTTIQWRETATNGLTYFRALTMFKDLPSELRMLVPLFCDSLMRIGTRDKTMEELEDLIKLHTGGISFGYHANTSPHDNQKTQESISLSGYALDKNVPAMYDLLGTILVETDFDSPKAQGMIKQLLQAGASGAVDGIASSGHSYAMTYSKAGLSPIGAMGEQTGGLSQVQLITSLAAAEHDADAMQGLVAKLKTLQALAVANIQNGIRIALTCGAEATGPNEAALQKFLDATRSSPKQVATSLKDPSDLDAYPATGRTFFRLPYQVSYAALSLPSGPYTSQSTAPLGILGKLLTHKHLHQEIREKGGAYGGGATTSALNGTFGMYSYRDPNPENTLRVMMNAGTWAAERDWSDRELEEAKLSVFQGWDAPISVNEEGMLRFLSGVDSEMEQRRREWFLDVDKHQVRQAAEKLAADIKDKASIALLGEEKRFVRANDGWVVKDMGMAPAQSEAQ